MISLDRLADWWATFVVVDGAPSYVSQYGQPYDSYVNGVIKPECMQAPDTKKSLDEVVQLFIDKLEEDAKKYNTRKICVRSAPSIEIFANNEYIIRARLHFIKEDDTLKLGELEVGTKPDHDDDVVYMKFIANNYAISACFTSDQLETYITYLKGVRDAMGWNKRYGT